MEFRPTQSFDIMLPSEYFQSWQWQIPEIQLKSEKWNAKTNLNATSLPFLSKVKETSGIRHNVFHDNLIEQELMMQ